MGKELGSVRETILDGAVREGLLEEMPRAETQTTGGSKPPGCLRLVQCTGNSSAEPLGDREQDVSSSDLGF